MRSLGRTSLALLSLPLLLAPGACGDELLQTASRAPAAATGGEAGSGNSPLAPLDCAAAPETVSWPDGDAFGGMGEPTSPAFLSPTYGALEGPGIYVAARDAFRLFVNGALVAESVARAPVFVPLSLLPGENVVAVAVAASAETPAVLVHVDELERSYESGREWKVSAAPTEGWTEVEFDAASWEDAREFASFGDLPGCDPETNFPPRSTARWIGADAVPGPLALRTVIRIAPVGFGATTTGGAAAPAELVDSLETLAAALETPEPRTLLLPEGTYDFRRTGNELEEREACETACANVPERSTRGVQSEGSTCGGTLVPVTLDQRTLRIASNKTIVGLGRGAALRGVSFDLGASENVLVRNVAVYDVNRALREAGDAFTLSGAARVWLDHVTAVGISDAFTDVLSGSSALTLSYVWFDGATDGECDGREQWTATLTDATASIHHSRFERLRRRAPSVVGPTTRVHLWNNLYSDVTDWTVGTNCGAELLVEGCVFEDVEAATAKVGCDADGPGLIDAPAGSNLYRDATVTHLGGDGSEPHDAVFAPPYDYEPELASEALGSVAARAGTGGPWARPLSFE